jgi:hypothetical protein
MVLVPSDVPLTPSVGIRPLDRAGYTYFPIPPATSMLAPVM